MNTTVQNQITALRTVSATITQDAVALSYGEAGDSYRPVPGIPAASGESLTAAVAQATGAAWKLVEARPEAVTPAERAEISAELGAHLSDVQVASGLSREAFLTVALKHYA